MVYKYYKKAWDFSTSLKPKLRNPEMVKPFLRDYYLKEAKKSRKKGDEEKRMRLLKKAIYFDYSFSSAHYLYAVTLFNNQKHQEAFLEALRAVVIQPKDPRFHLLLGIMHNQIYQKSLWSLYHLKKAEDLMDNLGNENLILEIQSFRNQLKNQGLFSFSSLNENHVMTQAMLQKNIKPLISFTLDLNLPENISKWPSAKVEQYIINLYLHLLLSDGVNLEIIYYQLGMLYWEKIQNEPVAFFYFKKAWDRGIKFPSFADTLNAMQAKLETQDIL